MTRILAILTTSFALTACSGVFESKLDAPQAYVLRLPPATAPAAAANGGSVLLQRPQAGPGLDSDRIALLRSDQRFDFYAASRWAAPAPDLIESVMLDALRATGAFSAVFDDSAPYAPVYNLRCGLRRFESDYTSERGGAGGRAPTVHVALDCTLGRRRDPGNDRGSRAGRWPDRIHRRRARRLVARHRARHRHRGARIVQRHAGSTPYRRPCRNTVRPR